MSRPRRLRAAAAAATACLLALHAGHAQAQPAPLPPPSSPWGPLLTLPGGLTPPPLLGPLLPGYRPTPPVDLAPEQKADSKRRLTYFWLDAEGGYSHLGLQTLSRHRDGGVSSGLPTSANGGTASLGIGGRFLVVTAGARARLGFYERFQTLTAGGELGLRLPYGIVEPHFTLGGGYARLLSFGEPLRSSDGTPIEGDGGYGRFTAGVDFFVHPAFSLGFVGSAEFQGLGVRGSEAWGGAVGGGARLGLHL